MAKNTKSGLDSTAEGIGTALGHLAIRLDKWKQQRHEIVQEIQKLAQAAQSMLKEVGGTSAPDERARKGGRKKGYKMSAETKAKLRAAWKRRKTEAQAGAEKTKPTDVRANIRASEGKKWSARQGGRG